MLGRGLIGAVLGACIAGAVSAAGVGLHLGLQLVFDTTLSDRDWDVERFRTLLPLAVLAGVVVGAIAGFAARLPRKGVHLLTSIAIVAGSAALSRLPMVAQPRYKGSSEPSYVPALVAALVGGAIVFWYGMLATRRAATTTDVEKAYNDQPHGPTSSDQPGG